MTWIGATLLLDGIGVVLLCGWLWIMYIEAHLEKMNEDRRRKVQIIAQNSATAILAAMGVLTLVMLMLLVFPLLM